MFKFSNQVQGQLPSSGVGGSFLPDSRYKRRLKYDLYNDRGRPLQATMENGLVTSYVWGYKDLYPVVEMKNAKYSDLWGFIEGPTIDALNTLSVSPSEIRSTANYIRSSLDHSAVSSYTYEPLIGMTSGTDASGHTLFYKYDSSGRLSAILDQDGFIIETYCYNYAGQQVDCDAQSQYTNVAKSGTFTKNDCDWGTVGETVTYVVPAGTYSSWESQAAADALAQADVDANGQAYANTHGNCMTAERTPFTSSHRLGGACDDLEEISREVWIPNAQVSLLSSVPDESSDTGIRVYADATSSQVAPAGYYTDLYSDPSDGTRYRVYEVDQYGYITRYILCNAGGTPPGPEDFNITLTLTKSGNQFNIQVNAPRTYSSGLTISGRVAFIQGTMGEVGGSGNFSIYLPAGLDEVNQSVSLFPEATGPYTGEFQLLQSTPAQVDGGTITLTGNTYYSDN